ncbi:uncharacterized protein B4U80_13890 [Leptotrombidium deliense]|uniref:Ig-like domain-containing protein n=1 Tax=Leptotrombidium deliense TaxID=299467 RepID=A0A443S909_9ACAR|nr:uncharacterized protein B4U80_13890 [Leptotrombidium deliense]
MNPARHLTAGQRIETVCETYGSRPPARITWILGNKILQYSRETYAEDGNYSSSVLEFIPTPENNASLLVCKAENHRLPNSSLEDNKPLVQLSVANSAQKRKTLSLKEESALKIDCVINANPLITDMLWFFNEKPLSFGLFDVKLQQ